MAQAVGVKGPRAAAARGEVGGGSLGPTGHGCPLPHRMEAAVRGGRQRPVRVVVRGGFGRNW